MKFRGDAVALDSGERDDSGRIRFRVTSVFDVAQVDPIDGFTGEPIPPPAPPGPYRS
jgi:hypothetical protein